MNHLDCNGLFLNRLLVLEDQFIIEFLDKSCKGCQYNLNKVDMKQTSKRINVLFSYWANIM